MRIASAVCVAALLLAVRATALEGPEGRWIAPEEDAVVEIAPCGDALCGTVVEILSNPDGDAGSVTKILIDFEAAGGGKWSGTAYSRAKDKSYDCNIEMLDANRLKLRPYVGIPIFGETLVWERAPE
ncbi:DUF2147 domain-containing protein [Parvibaculum sp.]|uniref:DUF2147 domain-containing protein n=1 Tax=Parvibaculum sp. TaxID=2024848 RepID=UPI001D406782|nr:DUF2147 domain-containing protein [Parvibaculum sp.]MBX3489146.1 DUF2147 domain-containing protein [Parvibaculum sp.]MCW5726981.1 DUF2147 domain-containing protein [Parvibaculum sp.]